MFATEAAAKMRLCHKIRERHEHEMAMILDPQAHADIEDLLRYVEHLHRVIAEQETTIAQLTRFDQFDCPAQGDRVH